MNRLPRDRQVAVARLPCEGNSIRSIEHLIGVHRDTVMRLTLRIGTAARRLLDERMAGLRLDHVQCDEILTHVRKKQGRLAADERDDTTIGDQFLFVAFDQETNLVPAFVAGERSKETAADFMLDLAGRILTPMPGMPGPRPQISTDGWAAYPGAVDLAFADTVEYGVIIKSFRESEQPGRYGPPELVTYQPRAVTRGLDPKTICTSHVERNNLTIRTFMKRFTRLALGSSKKLDNLTAAVALHVRHYNLCRYHSAIRSTPAMAAGVVGSVRSVEELLETAGALE